MDEKDLHKIIDNLILSTGEDNTLEFKHNNADPKSVGIRISALANAACLEKRKYAYLIYGVENDTHKIIGTTFDPDVTKVGNEPFEFWLSKKLTPAGSFEIYKLKKNHKDLVMIQIQPAIDTPVKYEGDAYIRIGSATPKLSDYPNKESIIWTNIQNRNFEKMIARENLTSQEVLELLDYDSFFTLTKASLPTDLNKIPEKMDEFGLLKKALPDLYDITNLGALLFARNLSTFPTIKRKSVRVIEYDGLSRSKRKKEKEGQLGYAVGWKNLIEYIDGLLPYNEHIGKDFREDLKMYPEIALREFVANALVHQDLSVKGASPMIEIFTDRIEITNPGSPLIETDRFIDHPPRSRNEDLASFMRQIGVCEESGSGVDRALTAIHLHQLPAPKFETFEDSTRVTLYSHKELKSMTKEDKIRACFQHCVLLYVEDKRMTNSTLRERLGIKESNYPAASDIIRVTREAEYIKESEKTKEYIPVWA